MSYLWIEKKDLDAAKEKHLALLVSFDKKSVSKTFCYFEQVTFDRARCCF